MNPALAATMNRTRQLSILGEIRAERKRQDVKFGANRHIPSFSLQLVGQKRLALTDHLAFVYGVPAERVAKFRCEEAFKSNRGSWMHILVEEVSEVVGAAQSPEQLREELKQVAAVCVAWMEDLDREAVRRG